MLTDFNPVATLSRLKKLSAEAPHDARFIRALDWASTQVAFSDALDALRVANTFAVEPLTVEGRAA